MTGRSSISPEELVDAINDGITRAIRSSGKVLPSSVLLSSSNKPPVQCEWTEFSTDLCTPTVEDLRQFFPPLEGGECGSDGRPMLYAACLGLLFERAHRDKDNEGDYNGDDKKKQTPLTTFISIAAFLLDDLGVDPDQPTESTGACLRPPLHLVARSCQPSAVRALVSRGADRNSRDREGWTPLMACCMPDIPPCEEGGPLNEERVDTIKALLTNENGDDEDEDGAIVNATNWSGYSALHYACEGLNADLVRCLLEHGADPTLRTVWGQTCVGLVMTEGYADKEKAEECGTLLKMHLQKPGMMDESTCSFLNEEQKAVDLWAFVNEALIPASRRPDDDDGSGGLAAQDRRIVSALMKRVDLDPDALFGKEAFDKFPHDADGNLYEIIHQRMKVIVPDAYWKVYIDHPADEERQIITCTNFDMRKDAVVSVDGARRIDTSEAMRQSFHTHRERGHIAMQLELLTDLVVGPLQRTLAFGVPGNDVLKQLVAQAPRIVEMGAGTGYWSCMLSKMGADVVAYDLDPPGDTEEDGDGENAYFGSRSYFPVKQGDAATVFGDDDTDVAGRALLMVWPNNPDAKDNKHVAVDGAKLPKIWDLDCLAKYQKAGGSTVIYVGERETNIELMPGASGPDCGFCASRRFQKYLLQHYELEADLKCPRWWLKEDDVTIWKRK